MKHLHMDHHIRRREYTGEGDIIILRGVGDDNLEYGLRDLPRRGVVGLGCFIGTTNLLDGDRSRYGDRDRAGFGNSGGRL